MAGGDRLAELAAELLLRGVSTEKVLAVLGQGEQEEPRARGVAKTGKPRKRERQIYITHEQVLTALAGAPSARTAPELTETLEGASLRGVQRHLNRAVQMGNATRIGTSEPFHFALSKAGRAIVARGLGNARGSLMSTMPTDEIPGGGRITAQRRLYVATLRNLGQADALTIAHATGARSPQVVRQWMDRAARDGVVVRHETNPLTWSLTAPGGPKKRGDPGRKGTGPKPGASKLSKRGENDRLIVAALSKTKRPMRALDFQVVSPELAALKMGTLTVALATAFKRGYIKRVELGLYALPNWNGKPIKAPTVGAAPAPKAPRPGPVAPAKQVALPLESEPERKLANGSNGAAHPPS